MKQEALARALGITEQAVGNLENRDASMDSDRRRLLCKFLDIPPILFGIIMLEDILKIRGQQKEDVFWWIEREYPSFAPGKDGCFPRTGQVVKYYREQKMDDKGKAWTQEGLAQVLGISVQAVRDIENKDAGMDHDRRHFLSRLFGIPPILFGIVSLEDILKIVEQRKEKTDAPVFPPSLWTPHKATFDVEEYISQLEAYWNANHSYSAFGALADCLLRINALYKELPRVRTDEWPQLQELLCGYHQFMAHLLRDHRRYDEAIDHLNKALLLAEWLNKDELKALVLHRLGRTFENADRIDDAVCAYEKARKYGQGLPSSLNGSMLLHTGLVDAKAATTEKAKKAAISLLDRVGNIVRTNQNAEDPYFLDLNLDRYHLTRSAALITVGWNKDAIAELKLVKCGPRYPRAQAYNDILEAQAHINLGKYSKAVELAESGLVVVQKINSVINISRVESIYKQLQKSTFKNNPEVARLDYLLFGK